MTRAYILCLFALLATHTCAQQTSAPTGATSFTQWYQRELAREAQVAVIGDVARPGVYQVSGTTTISRAIAGAGGFSWSASTRCLLIRSNSTETVELSPILHGQVRDVLVRPGDTIKVKTRWFPETNQWEWIPEAWLPTKDRFDKGTAQHAGGG